MTPCRRTLAPGTRRRAPATNCPTLISPKSRSSSAVGTHAQRRHVAQQGEGLPVGVRGSPAPGLGIDLQDRTRNRRPDDHLCGGCFRYQQVGARDIELASRPGWAMELGVGFDSAKVGLLLSQAVLRTREGRTGGFQVCVRGASVAHIAGSPVDGGLSFDHLLSGSNAADPRPDDAPPPCSTPPFVIAHPPAQRDLRFRGRKSSLRLLVGEADQRLSSKYLVAALDQNLADDTDHGSGNLDLAGCRLDPAGRDCLPALRRCFRHASHASPPGRLSSARPLRALRRGQPG